MGFINRSSVFRLAKTVTISQLSTLVFYNWPVEFDPIRAEIIKDCHCPDARSRLSSPSFAGTPGLPATGKGGECLTTI